MQDCKNSSICLFGYRQILIEILSDLGWLSFLELYIQDLESLLDFAFPQHDIFVDCCKLISQTKIYQLSKNSGSPAIADVSQSTSNGIDESDKILWFSLEQSSRLASDITWQQLNLGIWKNVDIRTKYLYSYAILINAYAKLGNIIGSLPPDNAQFLGSLQVHQSSIRRVLRKCDMGLMMGSPVAGRRLNCVATTLHRLLIQLDVSYSDTVASDSSTSCCSPKRLRREIIDSPEALAIHAELTMPGSLRTCPEQFLIQRVHVSDLSLERFSHEFMNANRPLIIEGLLESWPAFQSSSPRRWSLEYLRRTAGYRYLQETFFE